MIAYKIVSKIDLLKRFQPYVIPVLNAAFFGYFLMGRIYGFHQRKIILLWIIGFMILAALLRKHYKKIIVLQYIMAIVSLVSLVPTLYAYATHSTEWTEQPDAITQTKFKTFPNIYVIQPDGYANFSELNKNPYNIDVSDFKTYLRENNFKLYNDYRSNYASTVLSNSAMFAMKHHYKGEQLFSAREVAAGDNAVIETLKNNNYQTFLMLEYPYLLLNRPTVLYDHCNIGYDELPIFGSGGFAIQKELVEPLEKAIKEHKERRNFYFIEKIIPGHIVTKKRLSSGIEGERDIYIKHLQEANIWLKEIINSIVANDPNGLIVITADHGGYVGMEYTHRIAESLTDRDLIYSAFTAALAIKWPDNKVPAYDSNLKTPINLFRILFAYLGEDENLLKHLQENGSYSIIHKNAPKGVYKYIDDDGTIVFEKIERNTAKN